MEESTNSESGGNVRAREEDRLEKSWVVEGPMTGIPCRSVFRSFRRFEKVREETNL